MPKKLLTFNLSTFTLLAFTLFGTILMPRSQAAVVDLRIIETTDLHSNMMDFDYYKDQATQAYGFTRTTSLIHQARKEVLNTVLVDNGDLIVGSPMGDYALHESLTSKDIHPVYKALNTLNYAVGNVGNHEFNHGLNYLKATLAGAQFPYINANVYDATTDQPYFQQYIIIDTPVKDRNRQTHSVHIGYIGFVPPQIMQWDKDHLEGKVYVKDITQTAQELIPKMRQEGADVIVVIAHSGVSSDPYKALAENSVYYLSEVAGVDAIMFGHSHAVFPSKDFAQLPNVDVHAGTINGVPSVMPGQWGDHLGVIDLVLDNSSGSWRVTHSKAQARPIFDSISKKALVNADPKITEILQEDHQNTRKFVSQPIGHSAIDINSYLALVQADVSVQIVSAAQKDYVAHYIQGDPDLAHLPILSAAAPFKAGGRKNDPQGYVEVAKGDLSFRNAADLYLYSNTLVVVKISGAEVKEWLECAAGMFNMIDIKKDAPQYLINWADFRTYNFDVIEGVSYYIDVTMPARYDAQCLLKNAQTQRIRDLSYNGKPIQADAQFLVATNNYRANTGSFPGTGAQKIVFSSPDQIRTILANYIRGQSEGKRSINIVPDQNWKLAKIESKIELDIRFETSPSDKAAKFILKNAKYPMTYIGLDEIGFAVYKINLQAQEN